MAAPDSGQAERRAALARIREEVERIRRTTVRDLSDLARARVAEAVTDHNERRTWRAAARREVEGLLAGFAEHRQAAARVRRQALHAYLEELRAVRAEQAPADRQPRWTPSAEAPSAKPVPDPAPVPEPPAAPPEAQATPARQPRWTPSHKRYWTPTRTAAPAPSATATPEPSPTPEPSAAPGTAAPETPPAPAAEVPEAPPAPAAEVPEAPPAPAAEVPEAPPVAAEVPPSRPAPDLSVAPPPARPATPDDLTLIDGIGSGIQRRLNDAGITTFADLAASDGDELRRIVGLQLAFASWIDQAKARTAEAA